MAVEWKHPNTHYNSHTPDTSQWVADVGPLHVTVRQQWNYERNGWYADIKSVSAGPFETADDAKRCALHLARMFGEQLIEETRAALAQTEA